MELLDRTIEKLKLGVQGRATILRQRRHKSLNHCTQAPRDLKVLCTIEPYFAESHLHEIFPVRRMKHHSQMTGLVRYPFIPKMTLAHHFKQALKLINGENGGCRIVNCFRERLDRDVDDNSKRKRRILLDGALGPECDRSPQAAVVDRAGVSIQPEDHFT